MTRKEVAQMVDSIGLPYAYYQFDEDTAQAPPFVVFFFSTSNDLYADQTNYQRIDSLSIEFYSSEVDFDTEEAIETILNDAGLTFYKEQSYIESERIWQTAYDMEIVLTPEQN
jgi:hypothetical protein